MKSSHTRRGTMVAEGSDKGEEKTVHFYVTRSLHQMSFRACQLLCMTANVLTTLLSGYGQTEPLVDKYYLFKTEQSQRIRCFDIIFPSLK